jgi:hypothetical protein
MARIQPAIMRDLPIGPINVPVPDYRNRHLNYYTNHFSWPFDDVSNIGGHNIFSNYHIVCPYFYPSSIFLDNMAGAWATVVS